MSENNPPTIESLIPLPEATKPRKSRAGLSIKRIDLDRVKKRLLNILSRDVAHLLEASYKRKLDRDESVALTNYLKLLKELMKQEESEGDNLSDAELEALASQP